MGSYVKDLTFFSKGGDVHGTHNLKNHIYFYISLKINIKFPYEETDLGAVERRLSR